MERYVVVVTVAMVTHHQRGDKNNDILDTTLNNHDSHHTLFVGLME